MVQDYIRTQTKHRKAKKGHGWTKLERIEMDCVWCKFEKRRPTFFRTYVSLYQNIIYTVGKIILSCYLACNFANERLLLCQFDVLELIIDKIKQSYLK